MKAKRGPSTPPAYPGPGWRSHNWQGRAGPQSAWGKLFRLVMRRRRLVAAFLLCAAAAIAVEQLTPASLPTTTVLVAARDLPAGHVLGPADLGPAAVSPAMVPDGSLMPENAVPPEAGTTALWTGRQLSGPVRRGEVLTDASLLGNELLVGAPPGSQAVPVRLSDPTTLALLRQGQLVTVVLSSSAGLDGPVTNEVLASNVPVLWTPHAAQNSSGLLPAQESEGIVVVAASPEQAVPLAGAINRGKVFLILLN